MEIFRILFSIRIIYEIEKHFLVARMRFPFDKVFRMESFKKIEIFTRNFLIQKFVMNC